MKATKRTVAIDPFFNKVVRDGLNAALLVSSLGFSVGIFAESQVISISSNNTNYFPGESFRASILYETTDRGLATGIGIRVHYDSSQLSVDSTSNILRLGKVGIQTSQDTADYDNDPATDYFINAAWADANGAWPEYGDQPLRLIDLTVTTLDQYVGSSINVTLSSVDVNYEGLAIGLVLELN